jgi:PAS domain S-box-containing protein
MLILSLEDLKFIDVNNNFFQTLGYKRDEVVESSPGELNIWMDPKDSVIILKKLRDEGFVKGYEARLRKKEDGEGTFLIYMELIEIDGEQCVLGSLIDVTEKKKMEKEMAHLERMNLVGEMAAGIAHEIRNPMTAVRGFLQMLGNKIEFNDYQEYFKIMIEELDRANLIISEYLSLAKNKTVHFERKNINNIIKALEPLIAADAMRSGSFLKIEMEDVPDLYLNDKEIRQLMLNIVRNGLEAMAPGGELRIRTFEVNGEVKVLIKDHGRGIEPEVLEKIGTPFFTTKDNGTGLGLAVCFGIVRRHNASINIDSGSWGTAVNISFNANHYSDSVNQRLECLQC